MLPGFTANNIICDQFTLKQFAHNTDNPTVFNFNQWLKAVTNDKYIIIETKYLQELTDKVKCY
jgi:hypothetical protein